MESTVKMQSNPGKNASITLISSINDLENRERKSMSFLSLSRHRLKFLFSLMTAFLPLSMTGAVSAQMSKKFQLILLITSASSRMSLLVRRPRCQRLGTASTWRYISGDAFPFTGLFFWLKPQIRLFHNTR
jgi:hypothetical protein